jgi:hypothetical protein
LDSPKGTIKDALGSIHIPIILNLDFSGDHRNALWFDPGVAYETVLRLQFTTQHDVLDQWLKDKVPDLTVKRLRLIAKRAMTCE